MYFPRHDYAVVKTKLVHVVLSKEEIKQILNAPRNIKHRTMLGLIYGCGLRPGELLALKPGDIDTKRNLLLIKHTKGRKGRIIPLSPKILEMLHAYYAAYKPETYLFEGHIKGRSYDTRSLQNVLKRALGKTGINKPATLHWLRQSYATHLFENGTDLCYVRELLGHSAGKTTNVHAHVSTKRLQNIVSPFDYL